MDTKNKKSNKILKGVVTSDKMDKTIVVETIQTYIHPKFRKILRKTKSYKVHDETNQAKIGDIVRLKSVVCPVVFVYATSTYITD